VELPPLAKAIKAKLEASHKGSSRAIKREHLLDYLRCTGFPDLDDREMRECVEDHLPRVCSSAKGYYIAADGREKRMAAGYFRKKAFGCLARAQRIEDAYPEFSGEQQELPW
jgi:hypothetical protein